MGTVIGLLYIVGTIVTVGVQRHRAGVSQRGTLGVGLILTSLPWFIVSMAKMFVWPLVLAAWLAQARPPSPWACVASRSGGSLRVRRVDVEAMTQPARSA